MLRPVVRWTRNLAIGWVVTPKDCTTVMEPLSPELCYAINLAEDASTADL
jgi:hypothetical protein